MPWSSDRQTGLNLKSPHELEVGDEKLSIDCEAGYTTTSISRNHSDNGARHIFPKCDFGAEKTHISTHMHHSNSCKVAIDLKSLHEW